jgi:hypothetical protein
VSFHRLNQEGSRLLITSARQNNALSICHAFLDKYLLASLFRDGFLALAFFTSAIFIAIDQGSHGWMSQKGILVFLS